MDNSDNLIKILKNAPTGLKLYDASIHDTVYLRYVIDDQIDSNKIVCEQRCGTVTLPFFYNGYGVTKSSRGNCVLLPAEGVSWSQWQHILFPLSIGSWVIDSKTNKRYKIIHKGFIMAENDEQTIISMNSVNLSDYYFSKFIKQEIDKPRTSKQKVINAKKEYDKGNIEYQFKEFDPVLVKNKSANLDDYHNVWTPAVFGCIIKTPTGILYMANSQIWEECIPYTKETAKLIGTTQTFDKKIIKRVKRKKKNNKVR